MRNWMVILWPSFIVGGIGEVLFFTVFDPKELYFFGEPTGLSRHAVYSIGWRGRSTCGRAASPSSRHSTSSIAASIATPFELPRCW